MLKTLSSWLLYKVMKWNTDIEIGFPDKFIICLAPHTSNWDFIIGQLFGLSKGIKINFLMKKEWFFWPMGIILKKMGGIPVYRSKHTSMTSRIADHAIKAEKFGLCITPEGTRSLNPEWKKGFYYIALKAQIPILLYAADYKKKLIVCKKSLVPTGNIDDEFKIIKSYYKDFKGKHHELFTTGEI